jgi:hypothetical protein
VSTYPVRWLSTGAAGLAWHPVADASSYRLEVIDEAAPLSSTRRCATPRSSSSIQPRVTDAGSPGPLRPRSATVPPFPPSRFASFLPRDRAGVRSCSGL